MCKHIQLPVCLNWSTDKHFSPYHPLSPRKQKNIDNKRNLFHLNAGYVAMSLTMGPCSLSSNYFLCGKWNRRVVKHLKFKFMHIFLMAKHQLLNTNQRRHIMKDFVLCCGSSSSCCLLWETRIMPTVWLPQHTLWLGWMWFVILISHLHLPAYLFLFSSSSVSLSFCLPSCLAPTISYLRLRLNMMSCSSSLCWGSVQM